GSYCDRESGIGFGGDTAGVRLRPGGFNLPPTPPPDIDLEVWRDSLALIGRWSAETLFVTHFGPHTPGTTHLADVLDRLDWVSGLGKTSLVIEGSDEERETWFANEIRRELQRRTSDADAKAYEIAGRFDLNWRGLARYWRRREGIRN